MCNGCLHRHSTALLSVPVLTAGKTFAKRLLKPNHGKVRHVVFLYVLTSSHFRPGTNLSLLMEG